MTQLPDTVDDVLELTEEVIAWSIANASRHGYFAAAYKHVTLTIRALLQRDGYFAAPARIAALDVAFARRYLSAVFEAMGEPIGGVGVTPPWRASFATLPENDLGIMQHLMTGVTVHVHFDLGIAAAEQNPGDELALIRADFDRLNDVFSVLGTVLMNDLATVSPAIRLLQKIPTALERPMFFLQAVLMREDSWGFAGRLAPVEKVSWPPLLGQRMDQTIAAVREVARPPLVRAVLEEISAREVQNVATVIEAINARAEVPFDHMVLPT